MRAGTLPVLLVLGCGAEAPAQSTSIHDLPAEAGDTGYADVAHSQADASLPSVESDAQTVDAQSEGDASSMTGSEKPLSHCTPGDSNPCSPQSTCIQGCPNKPGLLGPPGGICSVPGRESCGCGVVDQPCTSPGFKCLYPSCCDYEGLCVTQEERAAICAGADAPRFACP
jgi:hypothetical protein